MKTLVDQLKRFETIAVQHVEKTTDVNKYVIAWDGEDGLSAKKYLTIEHGWNNPSRMPEIAYTIGRRVKELICDIAFEEGWFDQYNQARRPLPEHLNFNTGQVNDPHSWVTDKLDA